MLGANAHIFTATHYMSISIIICAITFALLYDPHLIRWAIIKRKEERTDQAQDDQPTVTATLPLASEFALSLHLPSQQQQRDNFISLLTLARAYIIADYGGLFLHIALKPSPAIIDEHSPHHQQSSQC